MNGNDAFLFVTGWIRNRIDPGNRGITMMEFGNDLLEQRNDLTKRFSLVGSRRLDDVPAGVGQVRNMGTRFSAVVFV